MSVKGACQLIDSAIYFAISLFRYIAIYRKDTQCLQTDL